MIKKVVFFWFLILFIGKQINMNAQELPSFLQILPVSPNAASLGVFGAIPVGQYTGTADISLPIYEIDLDGKKFPITLSYHASGIKVAQESGCVGLGWALQANGCIVKDVKGWDDFQRSPLGYYFDTQLPQANEENDLLDANTNNFDLWKKYSNNQCDGDPDLFHFNFANFSGTMFFNKINLDGNTNTTAKPIVQKEKDYLDVKYDLSNEKWKITDGDGYSYYFGTNEITKYFVSPYHGLNIHPATVNRNTILASPRLEQPEVITAWYLDSIVSPKKNRIEFEYKREDVYTPVTMQETVFHLIDQQYKSISTTLLPRSEFYTHSCSKIDQIVLKRIKTSNQTIEVSTTDRLDIEPVDKEQMPQKISNLLIRDINSTEIKSFILNYKYLGDSTNYRYSRLFLDQLIEKAGKEQHVYKFNYITSPLLPDKFSNETDSWGYYNGAAADGNQWNIAPINISGKTLQTNIPTFRLKQRNFFLNDKEGYDMTFLGKNEVVSDYHIQAGMLSSIEYPTGLKTFFEYEPHVVRNSTRSTLETEKIRIAWAHAKNYIANDEPDDDGVDVLVSSFELKEQLEVTLGVFLGIYEYANLQYDEFTPPNFDDSSFGDCIILKKDNKIIKTVFVATKTDYNQSRSYPMTLSPGKYSIEIRKDYIYTPHKYGLGVNITYEKIKNTQSLYKLKGGGLRIKHMYSMYDGKIVMNKRYIYEDVNWCWGILMSNPKFAFLYCTNRYDCGIYGFSSENTTALYACGTSMPYTPFSFSAMGNNVGYSNVQETEDCNDDSNRYINYTFYNEPDEELPKQEAMMIGFPANPDLRNGLLLNETIYNDNLQKVKETNYNYMNYSATNKSIKGLKVYQPPIFLSQNESIFEFLALKFYDVKSERWLLSNKTFTEYLNNNNVSTQQDFFYNEKNVCPSKIVTYDSDGNSLQTNYKYPVDYNDIVSLRMQNLHQVNVPIETIKLKNENVISGQKIEYKDTLGMLLPKSVSRLYLPQPASLNNYQSCYRPEVTLDKYNNKGKIIQTTDKDGVSTVYIWGYNNSYLVAEIKNATYDGVKSALNGIPPESLFGALNPDMEKINKLRATLPQSLVTTYTYQLLRGISTMKNPTDITTYYNYDSFGRLQSIKDNNNKALQNFRYNYRNQ